MRVRNSVLAIIAALAIPLVAGSAAPASAQASWVDGRPVFDADREAAARRDAERRKAARSSYSYSPDGGGRPAISPEKPEMISFPNRLGHGTIIIDTAARKLYYTVSTNTAYIYPISVGRQGFKWYGTQKVSRVQSWPSWTPPPEMRRRQPYLPKTMSGGIRNPLGAKAIYLGSTLYRIHGTNQPRSIGRASSSGCFRMLNKHVLHLAKLVQPGSTTVKVVRRWKGAGA
ncbi:MAG TPA: L,D-transpeptidase [Hyphomicrobiaceae bacterium]|nr:L,D-transpeptidase [Hyphomicrobiaceae bacterium]